MWYYILLIAVGAILFFFSLTTLISAVIINKTIFGARQDKIEKVKYFTPEDYGISFEKIGVEYRGITLYSCIYTAKPIEDCKKVVIFAHGFGAGSSSYMTEIAHFAKAGNAVIATDAYGCNNSDGDCIKGFYAGAEAVIATYIKIKRDERLKDKKIVLAGHSWGAYSVLAASKKISVEGVVAMSAFNAPATCLCDNLKSMGGVVKAYAPFVHFWLWLINACKFGAKGNTKAATAAKSSGARVLLIQGERDKVVPAKHSAAAKAQGDNVTTLILKDKRHNPYNTIEAEEKLAELMSGKNFNTEEEADEYYKTFDWNKVTEEDEEVMSKIDEFIESL